MGCDIKWGGGQGSFTDEVTSQDNPEGSKGARYKEIWERAKEKWCLECSKTGKEASVAKRRGKGRAGGNGLREAKALGASRSCRAFLGHRKGLGFTLIWSPCRALSGGPM